MLFDSFYTIYQFTSIDTMLSLSGVNKRARYILFNPIDQNLKLRLLKSRLAKYTFCKINLKLLSRDDILSILNNACRYKLAFIYRQLVTSNILSTKDIIKIALLYHCKPIIIYFLQYDIIKATHRNNYFFKWSCANGYYNIVSLLIYHKNIDPSIENNVGLCLASTYSHYKTVKLLLYHPEVAVNIYIISDCFYKNSNKNKKTIQLLKYAKKLNNICS